MGPFSICEADGVQSERVHMSDGALAVKWDQYLGLWFTTDTIVGRRTGGPGVADGEGTTLVSLTMDEVERCVSIENKQYIVALVRRTTAVAGRWYQVVLVTGRDRDLLEFVDDTATWWPQRKSVSAFYFIPNESGSRWCVGDYVL